MVVPLPVRWAVLLVPAFAAPLTPAARGPRRALAPVPVVRGGPGPRNGAAALDSGPRSVPAVSRGAGLVLGLAPSVAAVTPSLLPRPPVFQGILAGIGFTLGCGLGTLRVAP